MPDGRVPPDTMQHTMQQPVAHAVFSVNELPEPARYAVWRESISCIFEVDADAEARRRGFRATVDSHVVGSMMLARTGTQAQRWERAERTIARDGMDHYMVQLFEAGTMVAEHRRGTTELPAGGLLVFDLAQAVRTRTDAFTNLSLIVPRDQLDGLLKSPDDQHMRALSPAEPLVQLLRDQMRSLKAVAPRMTAAEGLELAPAVAAMVAACLNGTALPADGAAEGGMAMARLVQIKRVIERDLHDPRLTPAAIARKCGVSRSKLYALFAPQGGVADYVRERRLRRAMRLLLGQEGGCRSIADVALACGFTNASAFSRAFKQRFGLTPRDAAHAPPPAGEPMRADTPGDRRYESWLRHLAS